MLIAALLVLLLCSAGIAAMLIAALLALLLCRLLLALLLCWHCWLPRLRCVQNYNVCMHAEQECLSKQIRVFNLVNSSCEQAVADFFSQYGTVKEVRVGVKCGPSVRHREGSAGRCEVRPLSTAP